LILACWSQRSLVSLISANSATTATTISTTATAAMATTATKLRTGNSIQELLIAGEASVHLSEVACFVNKVKNILSIKWS